MKNIKTYEQFLESKINEEEGLKDWALGTALAASTLFPGKGLAAESPAPSGSDRDRTEIVQDWGRDQDTIKKTIKSGSEASRKKQADALVKQGWSLDSTAVDTLWTQVVKQKPDTIVTEHNFKFDVDGDQFLTGKFQLRQEVVDGINQAVDSIMSKDGIITDFVIESSTDKEPIKMEYAGKTGNDALAQRRAEAVAAELANIGVDPSIISIDTKADQGPDVYSKDMTSSQRSEARKQTADYRYVTVSIIYMTSEVRTLPGIVENVPKLKTVYYLSKTVDHPGTVKIKHRKHFKQKKHGVKIKKTRRSSGVTKCETFGNGDAWWNNLGW